MKIKVLFDANPLVNGPMSGVGYYTHGLVKALAENFPEELEFTGHYFNFMGRKRTLDTLPNAPNIFYLESRILPGKLISICRRLGFQLPLELFIHKSSDVALFTNYVSLPTLTKTKRVIAVHDLGFYDCPQYVSEGNRRFLSRWVPKSLASADLVITISNFSKERIKKVFKVPEAKLYVMPIPLIHQAKPSTNTLARLGLKSGYILFVGTIEPRKNLISLLNAYKLMSQKDGSKLPLVLAGGKGWNDTEILKCISNMQDCGYKIIQTGYVTDTDRSVLYKNATVCVLPSHYEGFGMPVLEAMSYSKPIACSDIPVLREVGGKAAVYFDKDKPSSIAHSLESIISSPEEQRRRAMLSKRQADAFPSWKTVASELHDKMRDLISSD